MADTQPADNNLISIDTYLSSWTKDKSGAQVIDPATHTGMLAAISRAGDEYFKLGHDATGLNYDKLKEIAHDGVNKEDLFLGAAGTKNLVLGFTDKLIADAEKQDQKDINMHVEGAYLGKHLRQFLSGAGKAVNGIDPVTDKPVLSTVIGPDGKPEKMPTFQEVHDHIQEANKGGLAAIPHGKWLSDHTADFNMVNDKIHLMAVTHINGNLKSVDNEYAKWVHEEHKEGHLKGTQITKPQPGLNNGMGFLGIIIELVLALLTGKDPMEAFEKFSNKEKEADKDNKGERKEPPATTQPEKPSVAPEGLKEKPASKDHTDIGQAVLNAPAAIVHGAEKMVSDVKSSLVKDWDAVHAFAAAFAGKPTHVVAAAAAKGKEGVVHVAVKNSAQLPGQDIGGKGTAKIEIQ